MTVLGVCGQIYLNAENGTVGRPGVRKLRTD